MVSIFRSESMQLSQLILHTDSAYSCIMELGELGLLQFRDTVPEVNAFQRKFANEVRRCEEMERRLRILEKEIKKEDFPVLDTGSHVEGPELKEMTDLERTFEKLENELKEVNASAVNLKKTNEHCTEQMQVLFKGEQFFKQEDHFHPTQYYSLRRDVFKSREHGSRSDEDAGLLGEEMTVGGLGGPRLGSVAGVILRDRLPAFERMLWRACRGNVFVKQAPIEDALEDPITGDKVYKSVFIIFFQGDQLQTRVNKICEGFHATQYACPNDPADRGKMASKTSADFDTVGTVLKETMEHRKRILETAAKNLNTWFIKVRKIKAIYHTLNLFNVDLTTSCMVGECWCAVNDLDKIHLALRRGMEQSGSSLQPILNGMHTKESPPTYHRVDKFTAAFQNIVDAYGVARYQEVNPALFTIITFPFLFAVMFGDAGHGTIMFLFALWMVIRERALADMKIKDEIWNTFFGGRYIILLMGLFSIYTGMIYNDVFSKATNIFGSSWYPRYSEQVLSTTGHLQLNPNANGNDSMYSGTPYPFGLDPVWQLATNKITFTNSIKMKMSIIFGVVHMMFGVVLSIFNHRYFRDPLKVYCHFIPQVLFLGSIFGYLVIMIFYKWTAYSAETSNSAPSLLLMLIGLMPSGSAKKNIYSGQSALEGIIVAVALICVPWMLLVRPFILRKRHADRLKAYHSLQHATVGHDNLAATRSLESLEDGFHADEQHTNDVEPLHDDSDTLDQPKFDFGEVLVYEAIHTIEYCLGCISNTASYLRLWALSLAHAQLSEVLWNMVLQNGLKVDKPYGCIALFFIFAAWAGLTVAVLILMEGLSAFLHALRLHWVEFNNKFYAGDGYMFVPFSFTAFIEAEESAPS